MIFNLEVMWHFLPLVALHEYPTKVSNVKVNIMKRRELQGKYKQKVRQNYNTTKEIERRKTTINLFLQKSMCNQ